MATSLSKSFTAVGVGGAISILNGNSFTHVVTGVFVGTWEVQKSFDGGLTWQVVATGTGTATIATKLMETTGNRSGLVRFACTAYTSGTIATVIAAVVDTVASFTNDEGVSQLDILDTGVSVPGTLDVAGAVTLTSTLTALADSVTFKDNSDPTKVAKFSAASITTATTRTLTLPDANDTLVGKATTDTLTNKTVSAGSFTTSLALTSIQDGLTAHAGGTQALALNLSASAIVHRVTTVGTAADSVALPAATGSGKIHIVANAAAANSMQVFGQATETINGVVSATGVAVAAGKSAIFVDVAGGAWFMLLGA